jgi:transcriptional regulator with XRE-family HTH domain
MSETQGAVPGWTLGDRLRKAREHARLTQAELAAAIGIARSSVVSYESGRTTPSRPVVLSWSLCTGVAAEWVLGRPLVLTGVPGRGFTNGSLCAPRADLRLVA